jgi:hypothetical protein
MLSPLFSFVSFPILLSLFPSAHITSAAFPTAILLLLQRLMQEKRERGERRLSAYSCRRVRFQAAIGNRCCRAERESEYMRIEEKREERGRRGGIRGIRGWADVLADAALPFPVRLWRRRTRRQQANDSQPALFVFAFNQQPIA